MRDTIDMAREAGWKDLRDYDSEMRHDFFMGNTDSLKAFEALVRADERKQIALDKMAENARELGLDYEPAEVLGHNGWGFPIKAAAPVQKKCDCAAHSAADCVCGAWDKSAVAPVQEDWGPGPHEYHNLTAAPVQDIGVEQDERVFARIEARKNRDAAHKETAQRSWVGLTDEEVRETISSVHIEPLFSYRHVARAIEAKLKAKNG
jgi:hypothetical protein